jgi:uncharacterized protein (TIGR02646 family)
MRKIKRLDLPAPTTAALDKKQVCVNDKTAAGTLNADVEWNSSRKSSTIKTVHGTLKKMSGKRERCMYCEDSHGTDIEHFWPKTQYPDKMFAWVNLLLCCSDCGRIKGKQFPLNVDNQPLLIDPTAENPWLFLDFDPDTGNIVARYDLHINDFTEKGLKTVTVLKLDRREALSEGYARSFRRLKSTLQQIIDNTSEIPDASKVWKSLRLADEHGLLEWCFRFSGKNISPFREFIQKYPNVANKIVRNI